QKGDAELLKGKNKAEATAKKVAPEPVSNLSTTLIPRRPDPFNYSLIYTKEELDKAPKGHGWLVKNMGHDSFPKVKLVKP
ncbi:hypothetical protein DBR06_SOUSAS2510152, partial [Sousa chinensis]